MWYRIMSLQEVDNLFNAEHDNHLPISKSTVLWTVHWFQESGSIKDIPWSGRLKSVTNYESSKELLQALVEDPHNSSRKVAEQFDMSKTSKHGI